MHEYIPGAGGRPDGGHGGDVGGRPAAEARPEGAGEAHQPDGPERSGPVHGDGAGGGGGESGGAVAGGRADGEPQPAGRAAA